MISDLRTGGAPAEIEGEVCVVGTGPAGMTIALELARKGRRVVLLEGGGDAYEDDTQDLYRGEVVGHRNIDVANSRLRQFGGTSGHWTGLCAPLDALDFEPREGLGGFGWPIRRADLDPFYARAQGYLDLGPYRYDWEDWRRIVPLPALPLDPSRVITDVFQQSPPTRFAEKYHGAVEAEPRIDCWLHANLTDVRLAEGSNAVSSLSVSTLEGHVATVRAKTFVLACGGIENARILLNARAQRPAGIGNEHGLVGRYYTDHMTIEATTVLLADSVDARLYSESQIYDGAELQFGLRLTPELTKRERLTTNSAFLVPQHANEIYSTDYRNHGWIAFSSMVKAFSRGHMPDRLAEHYCDAVDDLGSVATGVFRQVARRVAPPEAAHVFKLRQDAEQAPNPDSRVYLIDAKDRFGQNRIALDWRVSADDLLRLRRTHELIGQAIGAAGLGRVQLGIAETPDLDMAFSGYHHMGTTRMHSDPRRGVVDANCRVHSVENLYIGGSSVFTTGGCANPTLTIVALAIRLAERLAATA
ncbi:GMC oxidoreductase [Hansschlegelia zhihuaiae]|uniref:GMC family oxidoreductase n=1 Tax=Hansschlegelia zhihuaiae TaxID=405005 RepID=A0A4V1KJM7_9HYPH|nr:GMC family oxidoreductase [Hansschlegelia zhihuaiae]RXF74732.1 GMC family oxidoreductase [Hansschlegelia zhihuaiae]